MSYLVLSTFIKNYQNLTWLQKTLTCYDDDTSLIKGKVSHIQGFGFDTKVDKQENIETIELIEPDIKFLKIVYGGEGTYVFEPNFTFLSKKYNEKLSKSSSEYLKLKSNEENDIKGLTYYNDGAINPSSSILANWIIESENYINKYPNSVFVGLVKHDLKNYLSDFILRPYAIFDCDDIMYAEAKLAMEKFLKQADIESKAYQKVKKCYEVAKKNNFKLTTEYENCSTYFN